jgi:hypothetical protein
MVRYRTEQPICNINYYHNKQLKVLLVPALSPPPPPSNNKIYLLYYIKCPQQVKRLIVQISPWSLRQPDIKLRLINIKMANLELLY